MKVAIPVQTGFLVVLDLGNGDGRVVCGEPLVWHPGHPKTSKIHKVVKEQVGLVGRVIVLGNHKSEAYARVGLEVSIGFDVGVEVFNRGEVLEFEVETLYTEFRLPLK